MDAMETGETVSCRVDAGLIKILMNGFVEFSGLSRGIGLDMVNFSGSPGDESGRG